MGHLGLFRVIQMFKVFVGASGSGFLEPVPFPINKVVNQGSPLAERKTGYAFKIDAGG